MESFLLAILIVSFCLKAHTALSPGHVGEPQSEPQKKSSSVLPDIEPTLYDLYFDLKFYYDCPWLSGTVIIHMKVNNNASKTVTIDSKSLMINKWKLRSSSGNTIRAWSGRPNEETGRMVIRSPMELPDRIKLELSFSGYFPTVVPHIDIPSGFYRIPYVNNLSGKQSWLVVNNFRPGVTSLAFPCFDDPQLKAKFLIRIYHRKEFTPLSNMPVNRVMCDDEDCEDSSWLTTFFKLSPRMGNDQVRITISEFYFKNTTINETEYRVWARPGRLDGVDYALNITTTIQQYLLQELGKPSKLQKLDQFAVPEDLHVVADDGKQWGLATYRESRFLFNETQKIDAIKHEGLHLIARTLVYSFFETVSFARSNSHHIWLKEGLQLFYEIKALRVVDPTSYNKLLYDWEEEAMEQDGTYESKALARSSSSHTQSGKGSAILRMVESFVGANNFRRAVARFLRECINREVVPLNLWNAIQKEVGVSLNIRKIMSKWILKRGIPVISVQLLSRNVINATQKPLVDFSGVDKDNITRWYVPLCYRTKSGASGLLWMNESDAVFDIPMLSSNDWIAFNYEGFGYYIVNYDTNLWNRLSNQLNVNHTDFSERTRSKLLSDADTVAFHEQLGFDTFLNLTKYASRETELSPWIHIYTGFNEIISGLRHTALASRFKSYVLNLTSQLTDGLLVKRQQESHVEKELRMKILSLSCEAGHKGCIERWYRAFQVWIQTGRHVVEEGSRRVVYCNAIANSVNESDWNTTLQRFLEETSEVERKLLLGVLSCSRNLTSLKWLLDNAILSKDIDFEETKYIMAQVGLNPSSGSCVWNWYKHNYTELKYIYSIYATEFVYEATQEFKTREQYQELLDFYAVHTQFQDKVKNYAKYIIDANIRWMDRNFNAIANWLEQNSNVE